MYVNEISLNNIWSNKSSLEIRLVQSGNYGNEEQV